MIRGSGQGSLRFSWSFPQDGSWLQLAQASPLHGCVQRWEVEGGTGREGIPPSMLFPQQTSLGKSGLELVHMPTPKSGSLFPEHIAVCLLPEFSGPARGDR